MRVEYFSDLLTRYIPEPGRRDRWELHEPFLFAVDGVDYVVPRGFYTDFASVPRIFHPIINPYELGCGPIPHDFGYFSGLGTQSYWDEVFDECMYMDNVPWWKRRVAYNAVRSFGWIVYRRYREQNKKYALHMACSGRYEIEGWERDAIA